MGFDLATPFSPLREAQRTERSERCQIKSHTMHCFVTLLVERWLDCLSVSLPHPIIKELPVGISGLHRVVRIRYTSAPSKVMLCTG